MNEQDRYLFEDVRSGIKSLHERCNEIEGELRGAMEERHKLAIELAVVKTRVGIASACFGTGAAILAELGMKLFDHIK